MSKRTRKVVERRNDLANSYAIYPLEWDTHYFGFNSGKIILKKVVSSQDQRQIIKQSKKYEFITISNLDNRFENNSWIGEKTSALLVDINIQFEKSIPKNNISQNDSVIICNNYPYDENILGIAKDSFVFSRFLNDSRLSEEKSKMIYYQWTLNAFNSEEKYFVTYKHNKDVHGYLLFSINKETAIIELIAVNKKFRGRNIGEQLLEQMELYVIPLSISKIKVGTQVNNIPAINFYSKNNFKYVSNASTYHLWWG